VAFIVELGRSRHNAVAGARLAHFDVEHRPPALFAVNIFTLHAVLFGEFLAEQRDFN